MVNVFVLRGAYELEMNHDAEAAFRLFDQIPQVDSSEDKIKMWHFHRGRVFELLQHDAAAAKKEYTMAIEGKNPNLGAAHRLALLESRHGDQNAAIALWERIVRIKPDDEEALWHLSMSARKNGDEKHAAKLEARALKIGGR